MKLTILRNLVVLVLLMLPSSYGDTVTTHDHLSINGVLDEDVGGDDRAWGAV